LASCIIIGSTVGGMNGLNTTEAKANVNATKTGVHTCNKITTRPEMH